MYQILRLIHVLRVILQYIHENRIYFSDTLHNLLDEIQITNLQRKNIKNKNNLDIQQSRRCLPPLVFDSFRISFGFDYSHSLRMVGANMELLSLVRVSRHYTSNHDFS